MSIAMPCGVITRAPSMATVTSVSSRCRARHQVERETDSLVVGFCSRVKEPGSRWPATPRTTSWPVTFGPWAISSPSTVRLAVAAFIRSAKVPLSVTPGMSKASPTHMGPAIPPPTPLISSKMPWPLLTTTTGWPPGRAPGRRWRTRTVGFAVVFSMVRSAASRWPAIAIGRPVAGTSGRGRPGSERAGPAADDELLVDLVRPLVDDAASTSTTDAAAPSPRTRPAPRRSACEAGATEQEQRRPIGEPEAVVVVLARLVVAGLYGLPASTPANKVTSSAAIFRPEPSSAVPTRPSAPGVADFSIEKTAREDHERRAFRADPSATGVSSVPSGAG